MVKILTICVALTIFCQVTVAETVVNYDLFRIEPSNVQNAQKVEDGWKTINFTRPSLVEYQIIFGATGKWSTIFFNNTATFESPNDYLLTEISRDGSNWKQVDYLTFGKPFHNFWRDGTFASYDNSQMFLRTRFSGGDAKVFADGAFVHVEVTNIEAPEPLGMMPIVSAVIVFLFIWRPSKAEIQ